MTTASAAAIHAFVLRLLFPGYYDPIWPYHSDFYIPAALANARVGLADLMLPGRPVSLLFFAAIGHAGIRGSMVAMLVLVLVNAALTAVIVRRAAGIERDACWRLSVAAYLTTVFAQPQQYTFSTYDSFSQLSYFLLAISCLVMMSTQGQASPARRTVLAVLFGAAFLAKETYALSAAFAAVAWLSPMRLHSRRLDWKAALPLAIGSGIAALVAVAGRSIFVGGADSSGSPYQIVLTPASVWSEWSRYASESFGWSVVIGLLVACIVIVFAAGRGSRPASVGMIAFGGGLLALVPNSALPNHHSAGYGWNGTMLLLAPMLLVGSVFDRRRPFLRASMILLVLAGAAATIIHWQPFYAAGQWTLEQQQRQKRLLTNLASLTRSLNGTGAAKILVTGIDFPFSPFDHALAIRPWLPSADVRLDVARYERSGSEGLRLVPAEQHWPGPVSDAPVDRVDLRAYDAVWAFRSDGGLARVHERLGSGIVEPVPQAPWLTQGDLVLFPALADAFKPGAAADGYAYLQCGVSLLRYRQYDNARRCLERSVEAIGDNPYPHYYLALALEALGRSTDAAARAAAAVALDKVISPNPAFSEALTRMRRNAEMELRPHP